MDPSTPNPLNAGTKLKLVPGVNVRVRALLESRWLGSAEEVLAALAPPGAREGMRQFLELNEAEFVGLLEQLRAVVPAESLQRLEHPPTRAGGLGLRLPGGPVSPQALPSPHEPDSA